MTRPGRVLRSKASRRYNATRSRQTSAPDDQPNDGLSQAPELEEEIKMRRRCAHALLPYAALADEYRVAYAPAQITDEDSLSRHVTAKVARLQRDIGDMRHIDQPQITSDLLRDDRFYHPNRSWREPLLYAKCRSIWTLRSTRIEKTNSILSQEVWSDFMETYVLPEAVDKLEDPPLRAEMIELFMAASKSLYLRGIYPRAEMRKTENTDEDEDTDVTQAEKARQAALKRARESSHFFTEWTEPVSIWEAEYGIRQEPLLQTLGFQYCEANRSLTVTHSLANEPRFRPHPGQSGQFSETSWDMSGSSTDSSTSTSTGSSADTVIVHS